MEITAAGNKIERMVLSFLKKISFLSVGLSGRLLLTPHSHIYRWCRWWRRLYILHRRRDARRFCQHPLSYVSIPPHILSHIISVPLLVFFPVFFEILRMLSAPPSYPAPVKLTPVRAPYLILLKIMRVAAAPFFHIFKLPFVLTNKV